MQKTLRCTLSLCSLVHKVRGQKEGGLTRGSHACHTGPLHAAATFVGTVGLSGWRGGDVTGRGRAGGGMPAKNRFLSGSCSGCGCSGLGGACDGAAAGHPGCLRAVLFS